MKRLFLYLVLALLPSQAYAYQSTINPLLPVQNSPITSPPVRGNFQAAYNDINNIYSLLPSTVGTVTSVTCITTNGVSCSSSGGTAPALSFALGAITPSSVTASGNGSFGGTLGVTGAGSFGGSLTTNVTGSTQCLRVNSSGVISGTGSDCSTGIGTVTSFSFTNANGATGTVIGTTSTPALTLVPTAGGSFASSLNNLGFFAATSSAQLAGVISDETGSGPLVFGTSPTFTGSIIATALSLSGSLSTNVTGSTQCLHVNSSGLVSGTGADCGSGGGGGGSGTVTTVSVVTANGASGTVANPTTTPAITLAPSAGGTFASSLNNLGFFAATTSAQLAGVLSDESGTGLVVFNNGPTFINPALGTPASGVATNLTGTAAGLTAGTVTTNANLTGAVTSVGNATSLGSFSSANLLGALTDETGTGSAVFAGSPILTGTVSAAALTLSSTLTTNLTGAGIQCVQVSNTGVISGTGSACGSGGGSVSITAADATITVSPSPITGTGTIAVGTLTSTNLPKFTQAMTAEVAMNSFGGL